MFITLGNKYFSVYFLSIIFIGYFKSVTAELDEFSAADDCAASCDPPGITDDEGT